MSKILTQCPECRSSFGVPDKYAGKKIKCPNCEGTVPVIPPRKTPVARSLTGKKQPADQKDDGFLQDVDLGDSGPKAPRKLPPRVIGKKKPVAQDDEDDDDDDDDDEDRYRSSSGSSYSSGMNGGLMIKGVLMMVGALVWFFVALAGGVLFYYPPILFVIGIVTFFKGLAGSEE